jgi:hypothetical protein
MHIPVSFPFMEIICGSCALSAIVALLGMSSGNLKCDCLENEERAEVTWEPNQLRTVGGPTWAFISFVPVALRRVPRGKGIAMTQTPLVQPRTGVFEHISERSETSSQNFQLSILE